MFKRFYYFFLLIAFCVPVSSFAQTQLAAKTYEGVSNARDLVNNTQEWVGKIDAVVDQVTASDAYKTLVDGKSITVPFGIPSPLGEGNCIYVSDISMHPAKGMVAQIQMRIPIGSNDDGTKKYLYFLADEVPLSKGGSLSGEFKLYLLRTETINLGEGADIEIFGIGESDSESTYVTLDCKGFIDIRLTAALNFKKGTLESYKEDGSSGEPLSLKFTTTVTRMGNFTIDILDIPDIQFSSLPGFKCSIDKISLDKSDEINLDNFTIPDWYQEMYAEDHGDGSTDVAFGETWEGIYVENLVVDIPKSLKEGNEEGVVTLEAPYLIVDDLGLSVLVKGIGTASDPMFEGGNMKGFKYKLYNAQVEITQNSLTGAGFEGEMTLPICKEESTLGLGLTISKKPGSSLTYNGYAELEFGKPLTMNAFGVADMTLYGCRVDYEYTNEQFFPSALIDGDLVAGIGSDGDKGTGSLAFEFGGLFISSQDPYLSLESSNAEQQIQGFFCMKRAEAQSKLEGMLNSYLSQYQQKLSDIQDKASEEYQKMLAKIDNVKQAINDLKNKAVDETESSLSKLPVTFESVALVKEGDLAGLQMVITVHLQNSKKKSSEGSNGFSGTADFTIWAKRDAQKRRWAYERFDLNSIHIEVDNKAFKLVGDIRRFDGGFCGKLSVDIIEKIHAEAAAIFGKDENGVRYWFVDVEVGFSPGINLSPAFVLNSFTGGLYHHMEMDNSGQEGMTSQCETASGRTFKINENIFIGVIAGIGVASTGGGNAFNGKINFGIEFNHGGGLNRIATWGGVGFLTTDYEAPKVKDVAGAMGGDMDSGSEAAVQVEKPKGVTGGLIAGWFVEYDFPNKTFVGDFNLFVNTPVVKGFHNNEGYAGSISIYASPSVWYVYIGQPIQQLGVEVLSFAKISSYICFGKQLPNPPIAPLPPEIKPMGKVDDDLLKVGAGFAFGARLELGGEFSMGLGFCDLEAGIRVKVLSGFDILMAQTLEPVTCSSGEERGVDQWFALGQAYLYGEIAVFVSWDCFLFGSGSKDLLAIFLKAYVKAELPNPTNVSGSVEVGIRVLGKTFSKSFNAEFGDKCNAQGDENDVKFVKSITPSDGATEIAVGEKIQVEFLEPEKKFTYALNKATYRFALNEAGGNVIGSGLKLYDENNTPLEFEYQMDPDSKGLVMIPKMVLPSEEKISVEVNLVLQKKVGPKWVNTTNTENVLVTFVTALEKDTIPVKDIRYAYPLPEMENFYKNESNNGYIKLAILPRRPVEMPADYEFNVVVYRHSEELDRTRDVVYENGMFTYQIPVVRLDTDTEYTLKLVKSPLPTNVYENNITEGNVETGKVDDHKPDLTVIEYKFKTSKYSSFADKMAYYSTTMSEVFNGVTVAELSMKGAQKSGVDYEPFAATETKGYFLKAAKTAEPLIQFGNASALYGSQVTGQVSIRNEENKLVVVDNSIDVMNDGLKKLNTECLIKGRCSSKQTNAVTIPAGKFRVKAQYCLPGINKVTSEYSINVNLDKKLVLPQ